MVAFLSQHLSEILSFLAGLLGGSLITIRVQKTNSAKGNSTLIDQSRAQSGRDIVANARSQK